MGKNTLFWLGLLILIIGSFLFGLGLGKLYEKQCEGMIIGLGLGLIFSAIIMFRTVRRLIAFGK